MCRADNLCTGLSKLVHQGHQLQTGDERQGCFRLVHNVETGGIEHFLENCQEPLAVAHGTGIGIPVSWHTTEALGHVERRLRTKEKSLLLTTRAAQHPCADCRGVQPDGLAQRCLQGVRPAP